MSTEVSTQTQKVLTAIAAVIKELSEQGLGKNRENKMQGFWFRGIDDVLNAISPLFAKHHLMVTPQYADRTVTERQTAKGGTLFFVALRASYTVSSTEDGSSVMSGPFYGEAMDSADKATSKAMSAAFKYFAIQTFAIPVEGLPDADEEGAGNAPTPKAPPIDVKKWVDDLNAATTREQLLALAGDAKTLCTEMNEPEAWNAIKAARDARGKALAAKKEASHV